MVEVLGDGVVLQGNGVMGAWVCLSVWWYGFSLCFVGLTGCKYGNCLVIGWLLFGCFCLCQLLGYGMWWLGRGLSVFGVDEWWLAGLVVGWLEYGLLFGW